MKTRFILPCLMAAGALLLTAGAAAQSELAATGPSQSMPRATVTIDAGAPTVAYSPMIFGGFLEHFDRQVYGGVFEPGSPLAGRNGFRTDVLAALKELKTPIVRWPGGCYVSGYHWETGVGGTRRPTEDMAWGVLEPNTFGTHEYVELCRLAGWEPYICNNAGNGTVEEMKNWVEYCNGGTGNYASMRKGNGFKQPLGVKIWSIGNENWGQHEIGYKPIEQWAPLVLEAAKAMKSADPDILLTAAALPSREWTLPLLKLAGPYLDYISIHNYWLPLWQNNEMPDYLTCIMQADGPEKSIADFLGVLDESGYRGKIKIAYDEWNLRGWHHPGFPRKTVQDRTDPGVAALIAARAKSDIPSQYTMADALFSASFLNACLRHAEDVGMANIAPLVNTRGPLYVYPNGIVRRTHFHALSMYANELEPRVGRLSILSDRLTQGQRSVAVVDAVATVSESGKNWSIALVNRDPAREVACTVRLADRNLDGEYPATILAGDSPEAYNDTLNPNRVVPVRTKLTFSKGVVRLPPHSISIVKVGKPAVKVHAVTDLAHEFTFYADHRFYTQYMPDQQGVTSWCDLWNFDFSNANLLILPGCDDRISYRDQDRETVMQFLRSGGGVVMLGSVKSLSQNKLIKTFGAEFSSPARQPYTVSGDLPHVPVEGKGGSVLTFERPDRWEVLVRDSAGQPMMARCRVGKGTLLVASRQLAGSNPNAKDSINAAIWRPLLISLAAGKEIDPAKELRERGIEELEYNDDHGTFRLSYNDYLKPFAAAMVDVYKRSLPFIEKRMGVPLSPGMGSQVTLLATGGGGFSSGTVVALAVWWGGFPDREDGMIEFLTHESVHSWVLPWPEVWNEPIATWVGNLVMIDMGHREEAESRIARTIERASKIDPDMKNYDLSGNLTGTGRELTDGERNNIHWGKSFWVLEELRKEKPDFIADYFRLKRKYSADGTLTRYDIHNTVAILSRVMGRDLFGWFNEHGIPADAAQSEVK